jgi:hypothetical protein
VLPQIQIRLSVPALAIIVLLAGGVVYLFAVSSLDHRETIKFAAALLGGATAVYSLLVSAQSTRNAAARKFIERWTDPGFADYRKAISDIANANSLAGLDRQKILAILNFWEEIAVAVLSKEANETLLKDFFRSAAVKCFLVAKAWIEEQRKTHNQPSGYIEYERLYTRWAAN